MTQKDKIMMRAILLAQRVKNIAAQLDYECRSYDSTWALPLARELKSAADEFLKLK